MLCVRFQATTPAGCGVDWFGLPGANAAPAVAILSLLAMVLCRMLTFRASFTEIAPPAIPVTLSTIMLFTTLTVYQRLGVLRAVFTS